MKLRILFLLVFCLSTTSFAAVSGKNLLTGKNVTVKPGKNGTVFVFMSAKCPCSDSHVPLVKMLSEQYKDFAFAVVHSNTNEPADESKAYFKKAGFAFPVLQDSDGKVADKFGAERTPHAFVVAPDEKILFKGGVTNSPAAFQASKHFLREALNDVTAGQPVKVAEAQALGCMISRPKKPSW